MPGSAFAPPPPCRRPAMPEGAEPAVVERSEPRERVEDALADVTALLRRHRLVEGLVHDQLTDGDGRRGGRARDSAVTRQTKAELERTLDAAAPGRHRLHPRGAAARRAALRLGPGQGRPRRRDPARGLRRGARVAASPSMDTEELVAAAETLDADELADLAPDLPQEVMDDVFAGLPVEEREQLRAAMSFEEDMVGALMDFDDVSVRDGRHARGRAALPAPLRRAAVADRPAVRRRPRRDAAGRAAAADGCSSSTRDARGRAT